MFCLQFRLQNDDKCHYVNVRLSPPSPKGEDNKLKNETIDQLTGLDRLNLQKLHTAHTAHTDHTDKNQPTSFERFGFDKLNLRGL